MENATSRFLGRPGSWHRHRLEMVEGPMLIAIQGTGQVTYRDGGGETRTGVLPIPQIHRLYSILVTNDFVRLALDRGGADAARISLFSGNGESVTQVSTDEEPRFAAVAAELRAIANELFPAPPAPKPGFFARLFKRG